MLETVGRFRYGFTRVVTEPVTAEALSRPNYGLNTGAPREIVLADRQELARSLGVAIVWMEQIHSSIVKVVSEADAGDQNALTADAIITKDPVGLAVQVADCVPVLLFDETAGISAAVHAGRAGVEASIVAKTVSQMTRMGSSPRNITAAVGPCICASCYEVSEDMFDKVTGARPEMAAHSRWGTYALDLRAGVLADLSGVGRVIEDAACTRESDDLNSYRRQPKCGRQVGIVVPAQ